LTKLRAPSGLFGDRVHVVTNRPERVQQISKTELAAASIQLNKMQVIAPSLEDVFVSVLAGQEVAAADGVNNEHK